MSGAARAQAAAPGLCDSLCVPRETQPCSPAKANTNWDRVALGELQGNV